MEKLNKIGKMAPLFGFLTPIISYSGIFLAIYVSPWFTWQGNALSDLGAHKGSDIIFNSGLMLSGVFFFLFAISLLLNSRRLLERIGLIILAWSAASLFSIGLFPETAGDIHITVSISFFLTFPIGILVYSFSLYRSNREKNLLYLGFIVLASSLVIWLYPWESIGVTGVAIPEFLSSLFGVIWLLTFSYKLLKEEL